MRVSLLYKQRHAVWQKKLALFLLPIFILAPLVLLLLSPQSAYSATSSTLNFQGRLLDNTGGLVSDGSYNIEFNLYTVDSGGVSDWTETRLNSAAEGVSVQNGYFSVYLGDTTAFPASINWDQELWLGMTVRGTGSCAFGVCTPTDSEMTPRFKLTAVPYAFSAGAVLDSAGNAFTGDDLVQTAPSTIQTLNAAVAALRLNQTGTGGLIQLQGDTSDVFVVDKTGATTLGAGITIGNSSSTTAGTMRWTGVDLEVYDGSSWTSLTAGGGGGTLSLSTFYAFDAVGDIDITAGWTDITLDTEVKEDAPFTHATDGSVVTINEDGWYEITYNIGTYVTSGTSRSNSQAKLQENVGAGYVDIPGSLGEMYNRQATQGNANASVTILRQFTTGDLIKLQAQRLSGTSTVLTRANTTGLTIKKIEEAGAGGGTAFEQGGNIFGTTAILGTTDANGLNIITNNVAALTFTSAGAATFTNGLAISSGGLAITGDITGTTGLTVASGGVGDLTLDSASNVLVLADSTLRRSAAGTTTLDLLDAGASTTFAITNSDGTQVANLNVEGAVSATSLSGNGSGLTNLDGSSVSTGTIDDLRLSSNIARLNTSQTFTGVPTLSAGAILGNSTSTTAGAIRWSGTDFEGFDGVQWVSLTPDTSLSLLEGVMAFGKVAGNGTALDIDGATVVRNSTGYYTVTLGTAASNANYVVQLTVEEPAATQDDTKISIDNQLTTAFDVYIHEGDNGATADVLVDRVWHFIAFDPDATAGGGGGSGGTTFDQGGNAFTATAVLGTTDAFGLSVITNGSLALSFTSSGNATFANDTTLTGDLIIGNPSLPDSLAQAVIFTDVATNKGLVVQGTSSQSASLFELQDNSGNILSRFDESGGLVLGRSTATNGTITFNNSTNSNTVTLTTSVVLGTRTISLPDADGTICLAGSVSCGFLALASGTTYTDSTLNDSLAINKTTATGSLLLLERSGSAVFTVANDGTLQIQATATTALDIRNAGGTSYLTVDTSTGTTTIDTLALTNGITGAGLADCNTEYDVLQWSSGSGLFSCFDRTPRVIQVVDIVGTVDVNTATPVAIPFGAETQKTTGFTHDNVTNNSRVTMDETGWYRVSYTISSDNTANSRATVRCRVRANGSTYILPSSSFSYSRTTTDDKHTNTASFLFETTAINEYVEVLCDQQGSAGTVNPIANEAWLVIERI